MIAYQLTSELRSFSETADLGFCVKQLASGSMTKQLISITDFLVRMTKLLVSYSKGKQLNFAINIKYSSKSF